VAACAFDNWAAQIIDQALKKSNLIVQHPVEHSRAHLVLSGEIVIWVLTEAQGKGIRSGAVPLDSNKYESPQRSMTQCCSTVLQTQVSRHSNWSESTAPCTKV
jgi:hypothetical protein